MEESLPIISRLGETDPTQDTLSPFIYMPFLIATIASACFVAFRRIQAAEFYDKWKLKLLSYLPARSGRIRLSTHEQDSLSSENEIDDADSIDSNDDELPTSNNPNRESQRAGWNSLFDSFLRLGRDSSSNPSSTRNNGGGSRKEDGIGSAFWGRRNTRRSNSGGLRLGVESIGISTTSGINTLLERMSDGRRSNHNPSKSRSRDNLRPFSYQNLESPHSPGTSLNLFDLGEEDELETNGPIELHHEFALPSMNM